MPHEHIQYLIFSFACNKPFLACWSSKCICCLQCPTFQYLP